jgi:Trypsin-like peptidase domain
MTFTRTCPACRRRVPGRLGECRCGHRFTDSETSWPDGDKAAPGGRPNMFLVGLTVGIIAVGGVVWTMSDRQSAPAASATMEEAQAAAPPAGPADAAAEPAPAPAFAWPADAILTRPAAAPDTAVAAPPRSEPAARPFSGGSLEDVVADALPAVVLVQTPGGRGTGFFVSADTLLTNAHVVGGNGYVTIRLGDAQSLTARVVSQSPEFDLAVLRTSSAPAQHGILQLGDRGQLRVGQEIVVIGSPLGLQNTVTRGIVSGVRRSGTLTLVQTDAAINPGNSGGPMIDRAGRVVAVTTMKMAGGVESLGFGVAIEHARTLLEGGSLTSAPGRAQTTPMEAFGNGDGDGGGGDDRSEQGAAVFERALVALARRADQIDRHWMTIERECLVRRLPSSDGERRWFVIWEPAFSAEAVSAGCSAYFQDFQRLADDARTHLGQAGEAARRAGVQPGTVRQLRNRYRLDWSRW